MTPELIAQILGPVRAKLGKEYWPEFFDTPMEYQDGHWGYRTSGAFFSYEQHPADRLTAACVRWLLASGLPIGLSKSGNVVDIEIDGCTCSEGPDLLTALCAAVEATNDRSESK